MKKYLFVLSCVFMMFSCSKNGNYEYDAIIQSPEFIQYKNAFAKTIESKNRPDAVELINFMTKNDLYVKYPHVCDLINDPVIREHEAYLNYYTLQCESFLSSEKVKDKFDLSKEDFIEILRYYRSKKKELVKY